MWRLFGGGTGSPGVRKGFDLIRLGRYDDAEVFFRSALETDPKEPHGWLGRGIAAEHRGDPRKALEYLDYALTLSPDDADAWYHKGRVFAILERHEQALSCYERAIHLRPSSAAAHYCKGRSLEALERDAEALDCYEHALTFTDEGEVRTRRDALLQRLREQHRT